MMLSIKHCCLIHQCTFFKHFSPYWKHVFRSSTYVKTVRLTALGNGAYGTPRALYVNIDDTTRFIFNCGEGTGRAAHEHGLKLPAAFRNIFITNKSWTNLGGIVDFLLKISSRKIHLYGPPEIELFCDLKGDSVFADKLKIVKHEFNEDPMTSRYFSITSVPLFKCQKFLPDRRTEISRKNIKENTIAVAYIFKSDRNPPSFIVENCLEYGPDILSHSENLKKGETVTLSDGRMVEPKDVINQSVPGLVFIVIECPDETYLDSLLENSKFSRHQSIHNINDDSFVDVVVHFTSSHVMSHPKYKAWIERFSNKTKHVIINDSFKGHSLHKMHKIQEKLNLLHKDVYPSLQRFDKEEENIGVEIIKNIPNITLLKPLQELCITRENGMNMSEVITYNPNEVYQQDEQETEELIYNWKHEFQSNTRVQTLAGDIHPEITFLGTGSRDSSASRNGSGIVVSLRDGEHMLMDCGTGSYCQLVNLYGLEEAYSVLQSLSLVFISHSHTDHHLGLTTLLIERQKLLSKHRLKTLYIIAPFNIGRKLKLYHSNLEPLLNACRIISLSQLMHKGGNLVSELQHILNLKKLQVVPVIHCLEAYGLTITLKNGFKLVYSGDTRPCQELIEAGKDCNLLIHEATLPDELHELAVESKHCTFGEAVEVGHKMNAGLTLLTHFSKRARASESIEMVLNKPVAYASDFMRVTPQVFHILPSLSAAAMKIRKLRRKEELNVKDTNLIEKISL